MPDRVPPEVRRRVMSKIRSRTALEDDVAGLLREAGVPFRRYVKVAGFEADFLVGDDLIIDVRSCFWHLHGHAKLPRGGMLGAGYWRRKLERNRARDAEKVRAWLSAGYRVAILWECGEWSAPATAEPQAQRQQQQRQEQQRKADPQPRLG